MRAAPKLSEVFRYPVVAGTSLLAIAVTVAWWSKLDVSPLFETAMIRRGELWRLVTAIFPHAGILHLTFNLYWLWVFGTVVEEKFGHLKTAALIVLFAFGSSAWEFALGIGGFGLSGVGYGLFSLLWMLSKHDDRFHDTVDSRTVQLFVGWFFLCIGTTITHVMPVANVAHGMGAVLGILVGLAISKPVNRAPIMAGVSAVLLFGLWGSTLGRPRINVSGKAGYEEGKWGYGALMANRDKEAVRWLRDATIYQPNASVYWDDLGFAYMKLGETSNGLSAYRRAADLGAADAQYYIGKLFETGDKGLPKDHTQALVWYRKAADQGYPAALNNLAWAYATSSDPAVRDTVTSLNYARKAVELEKDHPVPNHLDTLAEALYANGQYEEAVKTEQHAIVLLSNESKDSNQSKNDFEKNLEKYRLAMKQNRSKLR